jgi:hypothetical protein
MENKAQQKAIELVDKFKPHAHSDWHDDGGYNNIQHLFHNVNFLH